MQYGVTRLATDFTAERMSNWRIRLIETILFFVPRANPDIEPLYPLVKSWALELTEDGWPQREVGLDSAGAPVFRAPEGRNTGFWPDMAYMQFERAELEPLTESMFEKLWGSSQPGA